MEIPDPDIVQLCQEITSMGRDEHEWSQFESSDMFQLGDYSGGFDECEMAFCFSKYDNDKEWWFQLSLDEVKRIANGHSLQISMRTA